MITSPNFKNLKNIKDDTYEVEMYKNRVNMDNLMHIGFFILQYAKLRTLEFYYDSLDKYLRPVSFELTESDIDSICIRLNEESLDKCVKKGTIFKAGI